MKCSDVHLRTLAGDASCSPHAHPAIITPNAFELLVMAEVTAPAGSHAIEEERSDVEMDGWAMDIAAFLTPAQIALCAAQPIHGLLE